MRKMLAVAVFAATLLPAVPAEAACHAFTVFASPSSPAEGGFTNVTVSRDGSASPSSIRVSTVDETARAPGDYSKLDQQVSFTGSQTSRTFQVTIVDDSLIEGAETFRLHLSNPAGCTDTGYEVGGDVRVTIRASDRPAQPTQTPLRTAPPVVTAPPSTATPTPTPSPTPTGSASPSPSPSFSPFLGAPFEDETGGGLPLWPVFGLAVGAIAAAGGAWLLWYRRRAV